MDSSLTNFENQTNENFRINSQNIFLSWENFEENIDIETFLYGILHVLSDKSLEEYCLIKKRLTLRNKEIWSFFFYGKFTKKINFKNKNRFFLFQKDVKTNTARTNLPTWIKENELSLDIQLGNYIENKVEIRKFVIDQLRKESVIGEKSNLITKRKAIFELMVGDDVIDMARSGIIDSKEIEGFEKIQKKIKGKLEEKEKKSISHYLNNPWEENLLPIQMDRKKCHFWLYSEKPNIGKTSLFVLPLLQQYKCYLWNVNEEYQDPLEDTEIVIFDEFRGSHIPITQLNTLCDGTCWIKRKYRTAMSFKKKPLIIVCTNHSIIESYKDEKERSLIEARFNQINLEKFRRIPEEDKPELKNGQLEDEDLTNLQPSERDNIESNILNDILFNHMYNFYDDIHFFDEKI